jgi:hypothetical protein
VAVLKNKRRFDEIRLPLFLHGPRDRLRKDIRLPVNFRVGLRVGLSLLGVDLGFDGLGVDRAQMRDGRIWLALLQPVLLVRRAPRRYRAGVVATFAQPGRRMMDGIEVLLFWIAHANPHSTQPRMSCGAGNTCRGPDAPS